MGDIGDSDITRGIDQTSKGLTMQSEQDVEVDVRERNGRAKYGPALRGLFPYRGKSAKRPKVLPSSQAGLFSFLLNSWLTPLMWKAFRVGLTKEDLWELNDVDKAEANAKRLMRIWENEKNILGAEKASFMKAVWKFGKTRFIVCSFFMVISVMFQFLGPAMILKALLSFQEDLSQPMEVGLTLAALAFFTQFLRNMCYSGLWMMGIHTAMRVEGAMQYMTFDKMLRLRSGGETILSQAITFCTNDQERIFECIASGVLIFAAPAMFLMCLIYTCILIGPFALIGNLIIFMFYPLMGGVARFMGKFRIKGAKLTNKRVGLMTEIMNSIRLIKMYGWEDSFARKVKIMRTEEEKILKKSAFLQSLTCTLTPMVNIVASVGVFLGYRVQLEFIRCVHHIFSVFSYAVYDWNVMPNKTTTDMATPDKMPAVLKKELVLKLYRLPHAVRSIAESSVCFRNFQKYLELPEFESVTEQDLNCDHDAVIAIQRGSFAWEAVVRRNSDPKVKEPGNTNKSEEQPNGNKKPIRSANGRGKSKTPEEETLNPKEKESVVLEDTLKGIDLEIKRGSLLGVCGTVGSGKSSLLSAVLGDMLKSSGRILIRGSLAVVSQQAWIYSDSLQENILFGSPMNKEKYDKVIQVCSLKQDIDSMPKGDLTIIGERGVNLSGGQKQRVNLARAVYADKSICLLDDPLAAVDSVIANNIFQTCIKEHLKEKTVILVTNAMQLLQECDEIIFMKDGTVAERGTHSQLLEKQEHYHNLLQYHNQQEDKPLDEEANVLSLDAVIVDGPSSSGSISVTRRRSTKPNTQIESFAKKMTEDDSQYKFAGLQSYLMYMKAGGGYCYFSIVLLFLFLFGAVRLCAGVWLQVWLDAGDGLEQERRANFTEQNRTAYSDQEVKGYVNDNPEIGFYQAILCTLVLVSFLMGLVKGFLCIRFVVHGASSLHEQMFLRILKSPMGFFDVTPTGKILNRFSKDMDELDARLPFFVEFVLQAILFVIGSLIVVCIVYPPFVIGVFLILGTMIFMDIWLNFGVRETKKLESVLKAPVVHHIQSCLSGLSIIRTFHRQDQFKMRFARYVNNHLSAESIYRTASRWFTTRVEAVGLVTIFGVALTTVLFRGLVSPAYVGLALSNVYAVCTFVPFVMRMKSELQSRFISVERILEYSKELEEEEPVVEGITEPSKDWPSKAEIKFDHVKMRYQQNLPLVLQDVSFSTRPSEKIGIVGRTGAGKTSIISSILRLYPIESGSIVIDDIDTSKISLKKLRGSIAVIPQDPVLFQGTLRYNLDPFDECTDEELWTALEKAHIKPKVEKEEKQLLLPVTTDGENFSVGEKQLICLSRALLRKNKILLLDEATASLDVETDYLIQNTIHEAFKDCTVITIAHRLNTVANYDRIIVMDKGKIMEMDTPENLMRKEESLFHKMMLASGISSLDQLKKHDFDNEKNLPVAVNR